jgi:UDP-N-acetylglucosamine transferase subunit ALG13
VAEVLASLDDRPLVLVVVGTDHHPFDRLVRWLDSWAGKHTDVQCLVQFGTSTAPEACLGVDFLPHPLLQDLVRRALGMVSHGGPGAIMDARRAGLVPVVVPRDPALGEHVDTHQQRFARLLGARNMVRLAGTVDELDTALDGALTGASTIGLTDNAPRLRGSTPREAALRLGALVDGALRSR